MLLLFVCLIFVFFRLTDSDNNYCTLLLFIIIIIIIISVSISIVLFIYFDSEGGGKQRSVQVKTTTKKCLEPSSLRVVVEDKKKKTDGEPVSVFGNSSKQFGGLGKPKAKLKIKEIRSEIQYAFLVFDTKYVRPPQLDTRAQGYAEWRKERGNNNKKKKDETENEQLPYYHYLINMNRIIPLDTSERVVWSALDQGLVGSEGRVKKVKLYRKNNRERLRVREANTLLIATVSMREINIYIDLTQQSKEERSREQQQTKKKNRQSLLLLILHSISLPLSFVPFAKYIACILFIYFFFRRAKNCGKTKKKHTYNEIVIRKAPGSARVEHMSSQEEQRKRIFHFRYHSILFLFYGVARYSQQDACLPSPDICLYSLRPPPFPLSVQLNRMQDIYMDIPRFVLLSACPLLALLKLCCEKISMNIKHQKCLYVIMLITIGCIHIGNFLNSRGHWLSFSVDGLFFLFHISPCATPIKTRKIKRIDGSVRKDNCSILSFMFIGIYCSSARLQGYYYYYYYYYLLFLFYLLLLKREGKGREGGGNKSYERSYNTF
eukprot:gene8025-5580_t